MSTILGASRLMPLPKSSMSDWRISYGDYFHPKELDWLSCCLEILREKNTYIYIYYYISIYLYKYIHTYLPGDPGAVLITKSISLYYIHKYYHISTFVNTTKFKFFFNQTKFPLDSTAEMRSPMKSEEILVQIHQVDTFSRSDNGIHGKQASKSFEISRDTFANKKNPHMSQFLAWS